MPKKTNTPPVELVEVDRTIHNLATHLEKANNDESRVLRGYNEDGTAKVQDGHETAGHSLAWYQSWGTPAKCPTCGQPVNIVMEPKE